MKCASCGEENIGEAKFCKNCGEKLSTDDLIHQNARTDEGTRPALTKGCRIWFWLVLVGNIIVTLSDLVLLKTKAVPGLNVFTVLGGVMLAGGAALILFRQKKIGLYLIVVAAIVACVANIIGHMNVVASIISAIPCPAISYYFVNKNKAIN